MTFLIFATIVYAFVTQYCVDATVGMIDYLESGFIP